jgi:hypothetical protein
LVRSSDLAQAIEILNACKSEQNLNGEIKWQKVTKSYLDKYITVMDSFFNLVDDDLAKVRIMFTNNQYVPQGLTKEQQQSSYHRLYYQFLKHAFGLRYCSQELETPVRVRLNLDQMPTNAEQTSQFKSFIESLNSNAQFRDSEVLFDKQQIAEVNSHDHVLLQCLDIVLGSMVFKLNNKHKAKQPGKSRRGARTIAKEHLYKYINGRVRAIYPNFNVGESTGKQGDIANLWFHKYRHWKFIPTNHVRDRTKKKP